MGYLERPDRVGAAAAVEGRVGSGAEWLQQSGRMSPAATLPLYLGAAGDIQSSAKAIQSATFI